MLHSWKADRMNASHPCLQDLQQVCMELLYIIFESLLMWRHSQWPFETHVDCTQLPHVCSSALSRRVHGLQRACLHAATWKEDACCHVVVERGRRSTDSMSFSTKRMSLQSTCLCSLNSMMLAGSTSIIDLQALRRFHDVGQGQSGTQRAKHGTRR